MIRTCCIQQSFLHISPTRNFGQYFWERDSTEFRAVKTVTLTEYTSPMIPPIGVVGVGPNSDWRREHSSLGNDSHSGSGMISSTGSRWASPRDVSSASFTDRKSTRLNSSHSQISYA